MEMLPKSELKVQLRDQRKKRNWTQTQLAEALGVTDQTVGRWERGETTPPAYYVKKLCDIFEMTPEALGVSRKVPLKEFAQAEEEHISKSGIHEIQQLPPPPLQKENTNGRETLSEESEHPIPLEPALLFDGRKPESLISMRQFGSLQIRVFLLIAFFLLLGGGIFFIVMRGSNVLSTTATQKSLLVNSQSSCSSGFSDDFHNSQWKRKGDMVDPTVSVTSQGLQMFTPHSDENLWPNSADHLYNYDAPRLLQSVTGNFSIDTRIIFDPQNTYQGAGLLIWQDAGHFLRLEFAKAGRKGIEFDQVSDGNASRIIRAGASQSLNGSPVILDDTIKQVDLRLQREDDTFTASWRLVSKGSGWHILSSIVFPLSNIQIGLVLVDYTNSYNQGIQVDFPYFHLECMP